MFIHQDWMELAHIYNPAHIRASHDEIRRMVSQGYSPATALYIVCSTFEMV